MLTPSSNYPEIPKGTILDHPECENVVWFLETFGAEHPEVSGPMLRMFKMIAPFSAYLKSLGVQLPPDHDMRPWPGNAILVWPPRCNWIRSQVAERHPSRREMARLVKQAVRQCPLYGEARILEWESDPALAA